MNKIFLSSDGELSQRRFLRALELELASRGIPVTYTLEEDVSVAVIAVGDSEPEVSPDGLIESGITVFYCHYEDSHLPDGVVSLIRPMSVSKLADSVVRAIPDGERVSTVKEEHLLLRDGVLTYGDRVIELSRTELELFTVLYRHRGHPVSRQTLHEMIWGVGESNVLDVYVSYLRKKLEGATDKKLIVTVRGKGYMLKQ